MSSATPVLPPRPKAPTLASPYKGLMPYTENDAQFFFGRETDTDIIAANLISSRLTLLYGPSGVGKSSALRAGVVNTLQNRTRENLAERGEPEFIVVYFNNWRDDPLPALRAEITRVLRELKIQARSPEASPQNLAETLEQWTLQFDGYLLIILDQFEEFFLYHSHSEGDQTFASEFSRAVNRADLRVNFLLSFREDALAKLDFFQGRIPNLFKNYLRIRHLNMDAARDAIRKPLERYNALHASTPPVIVEPGLIDALLNQVQVGRVVLGEAGRGTVAQENADAQIETPYLQLVLTRLWERERMGGSNVLQLATLKQLGGAEEIVRAHLRTAIHTLTNEQQAIAASVFDRLVTPSGTKIAQTARDLAGNAKVPENELNVVLANLASGQNRILRPVAPSPENPNAPRYEIFHDVLSKAILEWRAKYEKEQEQRAAENARQLEFKAQQQRTRRIQFAIAGVVLVLIVFIGLLLFGFQQNQERVAAEVNVQRQAAALRTSENFANGLQTSVAQSKGPTALIQTLQAFSANAAATQTQLANTQIPDKQDLDAVNAMNTAARETAGAVETIASQQSTVIPTSSSTPTSTQTSLPTVVATSAPTKWSSGFIYSAPTLTGTCGRKLKPEDFILDISFPQGLKADEAFDIRSRSPSKPNEPGWDGVAVIRESQYMIRSNKSIYHFIPNDSERGAYNLTVAVIRLDENGKFKESLSPESNTCVLVW